MSGTPTVVTRLVNARLLDPASGRDESGWLELADGRIRALGAGAPPAQTAGDASLDVGGLCVGPGLIDLDVSGAGPDGERLSPRELSDLAAACGITRLCAPGLEQGLRDSERSGARLLHAAPAIVGTAEGPALGAIASAAAAGAPFVTAPLTPDAPAPLLWRALRVAAAANLRLAARAQDAAFDAPATARDTGLASRLGLVTSPLFSEALRIDRDAALARDAGARLLVTRVSTRAGLEALARAKAASGGVAASVLASHLAFNELDMGALDAAMRLDPPLATEADRQALVDALADGRLDVLVSGHAPIARESKRAPFADAPAGGGGMAALLATALSLRERAGRSLVQSLACVTARPAALIGAPAGVLQEGADADLVVFDPDAPWKHGRERHASPFDGRLLMGRVAATIVGGRLVWDAQGTWS